MAAQNSNPYDPYADEERRRRGGNASYIPSPVGAPTSTDTGIPAPDPFTPPNEGGFTGGNQTPGPTSAASAPTSAAPTANSPRPDSNTAPTNLLTAPAGWDQSKWGDPTHQTPKYVVGRILANYPTTPAGLQAATAEIARSFPGTTFNGKDILTIPGVGPIDVLTGASVGGTGWAWQPVESGSGASSGTGTGATGATGTTGSIIDQLIARMTGGSSSLPTAPTFGTQEGANLQPGMNMAFGSGQTIPTTYSASTAAGSSGEGGGQYGQAIRDMVLKIMNQSPTDVTNNDAYRGAVGAYDTEQQRNSERERNAIAERMAAEGTLNTGGFSDQVLGAEQARGENTANFAGQLAVRELENQRDEIMQALNAGAGLLTAEQSLALSEKLGLINAAINQQQGLTTAAINQQQVTNQNTQFNQNLGWDMTQFEWLQNLLPYFQGQ
jgi:hypothetical protein